MTVEVFFAVQYAGYHNMHFCTYGESWLFAYMRKP